MLIWSNLHLKISMKKIFFGVIAFVVLVIAALWISGYGFILTAVSRTYLAGHPTANIDDYKTFDTRVVESSELQEWPLLIIGMN